MAGADPIGWQKVQGGGYTPAERWVVRFADGGSAFVKAGVTELTARWLRDERRIYSEMGAAFLPRLMGWDDDGDVPVLMLEDLSGAVWPPPWSEALVRRVLASLEEIRATPPISGLPSLERAKLRCWTLVAQEPASFLALGVCSPRWLEAALPALLEADGTAVLAGRELVHLDVRSDNICFDQARTLLVDWNLACVGRAVFDAVFWMPSLFLEWGPQAEAVAPDEPELAALVAGFFADRARLPEIPDAPRVRPIQFDQLTTALPWAARLLGLPPPGQSAGARE